MKALATDIVFALAFVFGAVEVAFKVNPIATLLTVKLMLDWLNETERATRLESAIARVIAEGKVRTYDMGGQDSTLDVAKAIADYAG